MEIPALTLQRDIYVDRVKPFVGKQLIKVLTGQRRVGKSFVLYQLIHYIRQIDPEANIIYVNKESLEFDFLKTYKELNDYVLSKSKDNCRNYIFIDEIQDIEDFEKAVRSLWLDENNDLYITGSNATMLSSELSTYLSGRYIEIPVYSLSYPEFLTFHKLDDSDHSFDLFAKYGGLPYLKNLPLNDVEVFEYLRNIYTTIFFRDVVSRYKLRNTVFVEQLARFLSDSVGSLFSAKSISGYLGSQRVKMAPNQVQVYAGYLANAYLVHKVGRYDIHGKRTFEIGEKYYYEDTGIRNALVGYKPNDKGKLLENIVYKHLLYKGWNVKIGDLSGKEIDFVAEKNGEKLYVQVALELTQENTLEREFGNLLKIRDNYPKIVVSFDHFEGNTYQGIRHCHIREFLLR